MSNDPNNAETSTIIKDTFLILLIIIITMYPWSYLSSTVLGDWLNSSLTGAALFCFGVYFSLHVADEFVSRSVSRRALRVLRVIMASMAMAISIRAMIEFMLHGVPAITWPMQKEWCACFIAFGIIVYCAFILIPPARNWLSTKISDRS